MTSQNIYSKEFLHHFKEQPHKGELKKYSTKGFAMNKHCGDEITIEILVEDEVVKDVGYNSNGCAVSQGSMAILSEYLIGKNISEVGKISESEFKKLLGIELTPSREACALVGYSALKKAVEAYGAKK